MARIGAIALPLLGMVLLNILGHCEMSIYPGLRRKPLQQSLQHPFDVPADFLAQLMEENARRRLQQQFETQLELINMQMRRQRQRQEQRERYRQQQLQELAEENEAEQEEEDEANEEDGYSNNKINMNNNRNTAYNQYDNLNNDFSFKYPNNNVELDENGEETYEGAVGQRIPFAVGPTDPRFYAIDEQSNRDSAAEDDNSGTEVELDSRTLDEYEEYKSSETKQTESDKKMPPTGVNEVSINSKDGTAPSNTILAPAPVLAPASGDVSKVGDTAATTTFHRKVPAAGAGINMPTNINEAQHPAAANTRHDITALIDKLQKQGKSGAIINSHQSALGHDDGEHMVMRQHLGINGEMGMYVVALIAGVSAAVTVGLIALGIAWYTLHNKTKAAADVEYPAYGVTGPNKDISPSGDRKLAQSAQMYHYQHQKQQIIAMENRQAVEGSCGLSDVESDDDNEEGDYTVYECPGLAPTGEMEVKNPLFLDETPVTPSSSGAGTSGTTTNTTNTTTNMITQATAQQPQTIRKGASGKVTAAPQPPSASISTTDEKKPKKNKK